MLVLVRYHYTMLMAHVVVQSDVPIMQPLAWRSEIECHPRSDVLLASAVEDVVNPRHERPHVLLFYGCAAPNAQLSFITK